MSAPCTPADLDRLRTIAGRLGVDEVDDRLEALEDEGSEAARRHLEEVGDLMLRALSRRRASLPPPLPEADSRWARASPLLDALAEMKERETTALLQTAAAAVAGIQPFLAAVPDAFLAECRTAVAEAGGRLTDSGERLESLQARLLRRTASQVREREMEAVRRLLRYLQGHRLAAIDSLYPLAVTWDRLRQELEERLELAGESQARSLEQRLRELRERPFRLAGVSLPSRLQEPEESSSRDGDPEIPVGIAYEFGALREALGLAALHARITELATRLQPPSNGRSALPTACLEAIRGALEEEWPAWRTAAQRATSNSFRLHFETLAEELERWLEECRTELWRRCGMGSDELLALDAMRFEVEDICRPHPSAEGTSTGVAAS